MAYYSKRLDIHTGTRGYLLEEDLTIKTLSIAEFKNLAARDDWQHQQDHELMTRLYLRNDEWDEEGKTIAYNLTTHVSGEAAVTSTLDGMTITYNEGFDYTEGDPDSLLASVDGLHGVWYVEGVTVVDEDGDELDAHVLAEHLDSDFSSIDYSVLDIAQVTEVDLDEESEKKSFTLVFPGLPSVQFTGELIGAGSNSDGLVLGKVLYSFKTGRWTDVALFKLSGRVQVCQRIARIRWVDQRDTFPAEVCGILNDAPELGEPPYHILIDNLYNL